MSKKIPFYFALIVIIFLSSLMYSLINYNIKIMDQENLSIVENI